jgi:hypothetical protein
MKRLLVLAPVVAALALAGCGGSSPSNSAASGAGPGRVFSAKVQACLKKQGVTLPAFRGRGGGPPGGGPPAGAPPTGATPGGTPPAGAPPQGQRSARFQKLQKALKACGATFPQRGAGGGPPQGATTPQQTS